MNAVYALRDYALRTGLIAEEEEIWAVNTILEALRCDALPDVEVPDGSELHAVLDALLDDAHKRGVLEEDSVVYRDLFDTALMGRLTPRPAQVRSQFDALRAADPKLATDWYYRFSQDTNYIRRGKYQGFSFTFRINVFGDFIQHRLREGPGHDGFIECFHVKVQLVVKLCSIQQFTRDRVNSE